MAYNLTIDCGNSYSKLALWDGNQCVADTSVMGVPGANAIADFTAGHKVAAAAVCNVGAADTSTLVESLGDVCSRVHVLNASLPVPVKNLYANPTQLGADRLAAACGAATLVEQQIALVVDMGTAVTYDLVDCTGQEPIFFGGNIAPGLGLRLRSLAQNTSRLLMIDNPEVFNPEGDVFADNTRDAILNGCVRGIAAEIKYYSRIIGARHTIIITGHHAPLILPLLNSDVRYDAHLVGRGLNSIIHHNEK